MRSPGLMNIVHVVRQFHPGIGGLENFVEQLSERQAALGHHVRVVTLDRIFDNPHAVDLEQNEWRNGIEIIRVPFVGSRRYPIAPTVLSHIKSADIVHVHAVDFFCDFLAAAVALHRKPLVLSTHGGFFHTSSASMAKKLFFQTVTRSSLTQYAAVIACSAEDARIFRPICGNRLIKIENPVDIDKFAGLAQSNTKTIIYFGRLAPNKEIGRLIIWFKGLVEFDDQWKLIIAGKPMGLTIASLAQRVSAANLEAQVEIHESPTNEALALLIGKSSVYACASSYEGFGLAAVEAASAGLFPVLSHIPPFEDTLKRLGFGMLVDFHAPGGWPQNYRDLLGRIENGGGRTDAPALRAAVEQFDWSAAAPAFIGVYERVLGRATRRIGLVDVDVLSRDEACRKIHQAIELRQPMMVAFCNAHTVNLAQNDHLLGQALSEALILNDGFGLDIASKSLFGAPFPENLNGTDFIPFLLSSTANPVRLFLLGGHAGVAEAAAAKIEAQNPHVRVVGSHHGFFDEREDAQVLRRIQQAEANLVLVAMGQPRQELWAKRHTRQIEGPVICVGALFDFIGERVPRAPPVTRKLRLEWAFRLAQEPRRLAGRYLFGNVLFLIRVLRQRIVGTRI